ncbi:hypothetical protein WA026_005359 [Henosepilachna vigintioctopunctata]|uniref:Uncharacterized protein n=1 Tax=Henosepilachna vigintioctopunctata TaxID=420089 RepID=A0AAW1U0W4_9CUCU
MKEAITDIKTSIKTQKQRTEGETIGRTRIKGYRNRDCYYPEVSDALKCQEEVVKAVEEKLGIKKKGIISLESSDQMRIHKRFDVVRCFSAGNTNTKQKIAVGIDQMKRVARKCGKEGIWYKDCVNEEECPDMDS